MQISRSFVPVLVSMHGKLSAHDYPIEVCNWYNQVNDRSFCYYSKHRFWMDINVVPGMSDLDVDMEFHHSMSPATDHCLIVNGIECVPENMCWYK
jgi:hypothetical protein